MKNKIPIVIKTWASKDNPIDFQYISQSIPSLLKSKFSDDVEIIIYDDNSNDSNLLQFLNIISKEDKRIKVIFSKINRGPNKGQEYIFSKIIEEYPNAPFFLTLDDDVIYNPNWYIRLTEALQECKNIGLTGVFTALNMPFRDSYATLLIKNKKYLLKWKQPALNWLVPMKIYRDVGPFKDEGIAYDTIYSHWMRLKHYPIVCLVPSYVQNIGLFGAYCKGQALTIARDFIDDNVIKRYIIKISYQIKQGRDLISRLTGFSSRIVAPIRWGNEFVYEGVSKHNKQIALSSPYDQVKLGWTLEELEKRCKEILSVQKDSPVALFSIPKNLKGQLTWIEYKWEFMPTIREYKKFRLGFWPIDFKQLFMSLISQLEPLHSKGIVHNKIRLENIFVSTKYKRNKYYLAWYGSELPAKKNFNDNVLLLDYFGNYVSRWATKDIKEMFATRYIETVAPEVLEGKGVSLNSDVFSAAMVIYLLASEEVNSLNKLKVKRQEWMQGIVPNILKEYDEYFLKVLKKCIAFNPNERFKSVLDIPRLKL